MEKFLIVDGAVKHPQNVILEALNKQPLIIIMCHFTPLNNRTFCLLCHCKRDRSRTFFRPVSHARTGLRKQFVFHRKISVTTRLPVFHCARFSTFNTTRHKAKTSRLLMQSRSWLTSFITKNGTRSIFHLGSAMLNYLNVCHFT